MAPSLILAELVARASTPEEGQADGRKFKSYYIIGIVIIALLVVGAVAFVLVRRWKKRAAFERVGEDRIQALSLNVRGIMLEDDEKSYGVTLQNDEFVFSKQNMSESDVKPEVSVLSANASKSEILEHYEAEGKLPRPFAPFMGTPPSALTSDHKADKRSSVASWASFNRHSFLSVGNATSRRSSVASFASVSTTSGKDKRTIRQTFNPVLPDELVVSIGERLQLVTSYDDGWCIVGRDSIFKPGEVELGAVPAWCFVKPVKGLRAERPLRTASLGVTINMQDANSPARDNIISWSNF